MSGLPNGPRRGVIGLFVDRPVTTLMLLLAVVLIGIISLDRLPLRFLPTGIGQNQINVWVSVPGNTAPQEVQEKVVEPLVELIRTIPGLQRIRTTSSMGGGRLRIQLDDDLDPSLAATEVRDRIQRVRPSWPRGVDRYFLWKEDGSMAPLAFVQLLAPERDAQWDYLIDEVVRPRLESVDGVGRVEVWGLRDETLKIWFDRDKLMALQLDFRDVLTRLQNDNFAEPCGELEVDDGTRSYLLRVDSKFHSTREIDDLPIRPGLKLSDVAIIERVPEIRDDLSRYQGQYTYTAIIRGGADSNPVATSDGLHAMAEQLSDDQRLADFNIRFLFDQGQFIREGLSNLVTTALQGGALALLVLWLFLRNLVMTGVIALSIPIALLVAASFLFFSGASLDVCTMVGLTLAVGMVVDNSVVVLENVRRHLDRGQSIRKACILGAREVGLAVTMSTMTTVAVFLPLAFVGSRNSRVLMGSVGIPLSVALIASLAVGLLLMPAGLNALGGGTRLVRRAASAWSPLQWLMTMNHALIRRALRCRTAGVAVILVLVGSMWFAVEMLDFAATNNGGPFRRGDITIHFSFPRGYDIERAQESFVTFEDYVTEHREEWAINATGGRFSRTGGRLDVYTDITAEEEQQALRRRILAGWPDIPGVRLRLGEQRRGGGGGMGGGDNSEEEQERNFVVRLWGRDADYLMERAQALSERLATRPEVESAEVPSLERNQEVLVEVDRERIQDLGVTPEAILGTMSSGLQGLNLGRFEESDREVRMVAQYDAREKPSLLDLRETHVFSQTGAMQRLGDLGTVSLQPTMQGIEAIDGRVHCTVVGRRAEGIGARAFSRLLSSEMERFPLARGYTWSEDSGHRRTQQELTELLGIMALSTALVFLLMGVLFESVILPMSILVTIPCALCGAVWSLVIFQGRIDPMGLIGMVILCGIVVNNGIVLLDHIVRMRKAGMRRTRAILEGMRVRMRPIFMTATTTFVGLLPMALFGDENEGVSYVGLSIAVAGGLLLSTITTAVAVPLFYTIADDIVRWLRRLMPQTSGQGSALAQLTQAQ